MGLDNLLKVRNWVEENDCIGHVDSFDVFDMVGKLKDLLDLLIWKVVDSEDHNCIWEGIGRRVAVIRFDFFVVPLALFEVWAWDEEFAQSILHDFVSARDFAIDSLQAGIEIIVEAVIFFGLDFLVQGFEKVEFGAIDFAIFEFHRIFFIKFNGVDVDVFETELWPVVGLECAVIGIETDVLLAKLRFGIIFEQDWVHGLFLEKYNNAMICLMDLSNCHIGPLCI